MGDAVWGFRAEQRQSKGSAGQDQPGGYGQSGEASEDDTRQKGQGEPKEGHVTGCLDIRFYQDKLTGY